MSIFIEHLHQRENLFNQKERRKKYHGEKNVMEKRKIYVLDITNLDQKIVEKRYKNRGFITLDSGRKIPIPAIKKEAYKKGFNYEKQN